MKCFDASAKFCNTCATELKGGDIFIVNAAMITMFKRKNITILDIDRIRDICSKYKVKHSIHEIDIILVKCHILNIVTIINPHMILPNPLLAKYPKSNIEDEVKKYIRITNRNVEINSFRDHKKLNDQAEVIVGKFFKKYV